MTALFAALIVACLSLAGCGGGMPDELEAMLHQRRVGPNDMHAAINACYARGYTTQELVAALVYQLDHEDNQVRMRATWMVGCFGADAEPAVDDLVAKLDRREHVLVAIEALADIGPPAEHAVPSLRRIAIEGDPSERSHATEALAKIGASLVYDVPILISGLRDDQRVVRMQSAHALGTCAPAGEEIISPLLAVFTMDDWSEVRRAAVMSLAMLGVSPPEATADFQKAAQAQDPVMRLYAAYHLVQLGHDVDTVWPIFVEMVDEGHVTWRADALRIVSGIDDARAEPLVRERLSHPDPEMRTAVAVALLCMKADDADALTVLLDALKSPTFETREFAVWCVDFMDLEAATIGDHLHAVSVDDSDYRIRRDLRKHIATWSTANRSARTR